MKKLLIYTAGSGSREVLLAVRQLNEFEPTWDILGFVDRDPNIIGKEVDGYPVYGPEHKEIANDVFVFCGIMNPRIRQRLVEEQIEGKGLALASIIHPSVVIPKDFEAGPGTIIMAHVFVSFNVKLGKCVMVLPGVILGHDLLGHDYATVLPSTTINGMCIIGERALICSGVTLNVGTSVGSDSVIGIGTTVLTDVGDNKRIVALPRQIVSDHRQE